MRQRGKFFEMSRQGGRRRRHRGTQGAVHAGRGFQLTIVTATVHHHHDSACGANHLKMVRLDDSGRYGGTQKERKPHQHQFGDEFGAAQGLHGVIISKSEHGLDISVPDVCIGLSSARNLMLLA